MRIRDMVTPDELSFHFFTSISETSRFHSHSLSNRALRNLMLVIIICLFPYLTSCRVDLIKFSFADARVVSYFLARSVICFVLLTGNNGNTRNAWHARTERCQGR